MQARASFWICENSKCKEQNSFEKTKCKKCGNEVSVEHKKRTIHLEFCKRILTDTISDESLRNRFFKKPDSITNEEMLSAIAEPVDLTSIVGNFWPKRAHTMIGILRLNNLQQCIEDIIKNDIKGDLIEAGIWRGGAVIFIKLILNDYEIKNKTIYAADSFEGLPKPDEKKFPADKGDTLHKTDFLKISLREVKKNFEQYGVLDDKVKFLEGWFEDTLIDPSLEKFAILHLDGDMYGSTWTALENLYDKLSIGGYVIVDDYSLSGCSKAVDDFRALYGIKELIQQVDWTGIYWKKENELDKKSKERFLGEQNITNQDLKKTIEDKNNTIRNLENTIKAIQNSFTWRTLTKFDKFRKRFFS